MSTPSTPATTNSPETLFAALGRVMARATTALDRAGVAQALAVGLVEEFGAARTRLWLYDPAGHAFHLRASAGDAEPVAAVARIPAGEVESEVIRRLLDRQVVVLDHLTSEMGFSDPERLAAHGVRAYAGLPLEIEGRLVGTMSVFSATPWSPIAIEALKVLAQQAALALDYARMIEESRTLRAIASEVASAPDTRALLDRLVERVAVALGVDGCAVWLQDADGDLLPMATHGLSRRFLDQPKSPNRTAFRLFQRIARPLYTRDDPEEMARANQEIAAEVAAEGIISALRLPLFQPGGYVVGMLALYHRRERPYGDGEIRLAQALTDQVAAALYHLRLAEDERAAREAAARQLDRLRTITRITEQLLGATDLDQVLRVVVEAGYRLCGASMAMVGLIDESGRLLVPVAAEGEPQDFFIRFARPVLDEAYMRNTITGRALAGRTPVASDDYAAWHIPHPVQQSTVELGVRALVAAPLLVRGEPIGVLWVMDVKTRPFSDDEMALVQALADQAALAIRQARLARRGQEAAVLEERARLARDLHDSVTQSVFSLGMLARAAQTQYTRGVPALGGTLDRIGTLSQDALSEMRALLFELRPTALAEEGLGVALERLVAALRARTETAIEFVRSTEARPAPDAELALFRIAQEAIGNAIKHAGATRITAALAHIDERLLLTVRDDGRGFDPAAPYVEPQGGQSGGMGLRSMRERAASAGVKLSIASTPGAGTTVRAEADVA